MERMEEEQIQVRGNPVFLDLLGGVEHLLTLPTRSIHPGSLCGSSCKWVGWILPLSVCFVYLCIYYVGYEFGLFYVFALCSKSTDESREVTGSSNQHSYILHICAQYNILWQGMVAALVQYHMYRCASSCVRSQYSKSVHMNMYRDQVMFLVVVVRLVA
ncbi:hypothetical protein Y032_0459g1841 [Ancylostoma ceylanicum]|uniref:Uncharacterized protein n=1 Tax=Ancylostoma ceylanicum TaxID=53326 RepID=A0A016WY55_9BILA|nr:hypothetical protein Y032_0459g1841 [Ancylostoma ceylanicum]